MLISLSLKFKFESPKHSKLLKAILSTILFSAVVIILSYKADLAKVI